MKRFGHLLLLFSLTATLLMPVFAFADAGPGQAGAAVKTDAQTAAELGLLSGDGDGINTAYLSKGSTRIQAAIISLRLQGKLTEATAFLGTTSFADSNLVGKGNQAILAYLHSHPEYGWSGAGANHFDPLAPISSQQLYKVLLEVLGFKSNVDFDYKNTEMFAASKGLTQIAGISKLTNAHIASALIETLSAQMSAGHILFDMLKEQGVIAASAALPAGERVELRTDPKLGTFFTDGKGRTLYFFSNDAQNLDACQGKCITSWPFLTSDQLQIPATLNAVDFTKLTHADGTSQWMYKGWPLYTFVKDVKAGDTLGEGVNGVWFVAKSDYRVMIGASSDLGSYLTDDHGRTLYYFDKDIPQMSACEGDCLTNWPAYTSSSGSIPSSLNVADLGMITRSDGSKQTAFKGYPLYYFIKDLKHGDASGQNVNQIWFVVNPTEFKGTKASQTMSQPSDTAKTYHIDIKDYSFGSGPFTVEAGSRIIFTNFDDMQHNAVAVNGSFSLPLLSKGDTYTITLDKPGTYDYYCQPHKSFMTGQIIVK